VGPTEFELYAEKIYATDRHGNSKGMVEGDSMSIESRRELELTRTKLKLLEDRLTTLA
jgi:hypothetical protein